MCLKTKSCEGLTETWTPHDTRAQVIDFTHRWSSERTGLRSLQMLGWVGIACSKFPGQKPRISSDNANRFFQLPLNQSM
jgi:hypothetical protein